VGYLNDYSPNGAIYCIRFAVLTAKAIIYFFCGPQNRIVSGKKRTILKFMAGRTPS
jgi:hypothetical protein